MSDQEIHRIDGRARTVRELLDGARYTIDFYQREYAWKARQVQELIDDLSGKFLDSYRPDHHREDVARYGCRRSRGNAAKRSRLARSFCV
jgi:hypothetical protein